MNENAIVEFEYANEIESINIANIPDIIAERIEGISALEKEVKNSDDSAKSAMEYVGTKMTRYEEKGFWLFKHRSGNTKDTIEDTQEAIEKLAKAQQVSVSAMKKSFEFQRKLADIAKYLLILGSASIASNRTTVREIEMRLGGASKKEISELAKKEMMNVLKQLKAQEDILKKQEFLSSKVEENVTRLDEKDTIDKEQSERLEELGRLLDSKDLLDQKQEEEINKNAKAIQVLFEYTKQKDILDKEQSERIDSLTNEKKECLEQVEIIKSSAKKFCITAIIISVCVLVCSVASIIMKFFL